MGRSYAEWHVALSTTMSDAVPTPEASFRKIIPMLRVRSPAASAGWYHRILGVHYHVNREHMASVYKGTHAEVNIYLMKAESDVIPLGEVMIMVDLPLGSKEKDEEGKVVRELYDALRVKEGVVVKWELKKEAWGYYQFSILDPDGELLFP